MGTATTYSAQLVGLHTELIAIEVDISNGLHAFSVVGLGDRAVEEAKDRISAAIKNSGYTSPKQKNQKVVISLAPADTRKEGPSFDVSMALAYLAATGDIEFDSANILFLGELSLEGNIRRVSGLLPILCGAPALGFTSAYIPYDNREEASLAQGLVIYPVSTMREIIDHLTGKVHITPLERYKVRDEQGRSGGADLAPNDMCMIRGNETAKRGLEIAAAGAHNVIMYGPPGTGKTMLAHSLSSILPPLSYEHAVEVTGIHSAARTLKGGLMMLPPFRAPHHTASYPAIVGGGSFPKPGEISLAHRGILFLDEFPEFDRDVIEALRQPLEDRVITISRARGSVTFPAQCILVGSMNPCPCGKGRESGCTCSERTLASYRRRLSGPIMDRIDIWISVAKIDYDKLAERRASSEDSSSIRARVTAARARQLMRFSAKKKPISYNSEMGAGDLESCVTISDSARDTLRSAAERLGFSGRAFHRVIKIAQTIADLDKSDIVDKIHVLEALQYREKIT